MEYSNRFFIFVKKLIMRMNKSTQKRKELVRDIVEAYYEPGSQSSCKLQIYRHHIAPSMGISQRTFFRYLSSHGQPLSDERWRELQLSIPF